MLLARTNTLDNLSVTSDDNVSFDIDDIKTFTFDNRFVSGGLSGTFSFTAGVADNFTYVGIAGHNLGSLGATITITNHGVQDVVNYAPIDDRVLMFALVGRTGGANDLVITITKQSAGDQVVLNHVAAGFTTDLTTQSLSGQTVCTDYGAGYPRIPMLVPRKLRTTINGQGAPTATLTKTVSSKVNLSLKDIPTEFAMVNLVAYQKFWVDNGFFIQNDELTDQSYLAFNFIPAAPKTHSSVRELVNLSYSFMGYNGQ